MRRDVLKLISEQKSLTHVIVLTHDIDFVFVETLVLGALRRCGAPSLTVFADAACASDTYQSQWRVLSQLGRGYRVASVSMQPGYRFHPKAVLLVARESATLLVGSGNLTFGGWRDNAEVWAQYSTAEATGEFSAFRHYLKDVVGRVALPDTPAAEIEDAFDESRHDWARDMGHASGLLGRCGDGRSLFHGIDQEVGDRPVDKLTICSPYFDPAGDALAAFTASPRHHRVEVMVAGEGGNLSEGAAQKLPANSDLFAAWGQPRSEDGAGHPFLHAKVYAFQRGNDALVFVGSANCSRAALLSDGPKGNAELLAVQQLPVEELVSRVLDEVRVEHRPPKMLSAIELNSRPPGQPVPRVTAARLENGVLRIAYTETRGWQASSAIVGDIVTPIHPLTDHMCEAVAPTTARSVRLAGLLDGLAFETMPYWVDDEAELAVRASQRALEGAIRRKAGQSEWDLGDWQQVVELFCEDLQNTPIARRLVGPPADRGNAPLPFSRAQAFPAHMNWPARHPTSPGTRESASGSLSALLMHWFLQAAEGATVDPAPEPIVEIKDTGDEDEERVDAPIVTPPVKPPKPSPPPAPTTAKDRKKAGDLLKKIVSAMTSEAYRAHRHPKDLAKDLKLTGLVVRLARAKSWLQHDDVVEATCAIWASLFLGDDQGALARHLDTEGDITREFLETPSVAAALFAWSLELVEQPVSPRDAQAWLILALSICRHPWVWGVHNIPALAEEVERILLATVGGFSESAIAERWNSATTLGDALHELGRRLATKPLASWTPKTPPSHLPAGTLIWQGQIGYCVTQNAVTQQGQIVLCLPVDVSSASARKLKSTFLNPVAGLLSDPDVRTGMKDAHIAALLESVACAKKIVEPKTTGRPVSRKRGDAR